MPNNPATPQDASPNHEAQGYGYMLGSVLFFSLIPYYLQFLQPLSGNMLFIHRVFGQALCILLIILSIGHFHVLWGALLNRKVIINLLFTTPFVAAQWWVFFWAPVNGHTIDIAMGYFLLPLTMALSGRLLFKETMRPLQWLALGLAVTGISLELFRSGVFSWVTLIVCLGFPPYFILRRKLKFTVDTNINFALENLLVLPFALIFLCLEIQNGQPWWPEREWGFIWLLGAGLLATIPMLLFVAASQRLSFTVFGMLNYIEPVLLILVAVLLLNESVSEAQFLSYSFFAFAVSLVITDSVRQWRAKA